MTATLRAGWALTPLPTNRDESLLGYDFRQEKLAPGNSGEHDPLFARALVLRQIRNSTTASDVTSVSACLVTLDHCIISVSLARRLRERIGHACGVPAAHVIIACSHTHSAPLAHDPELDADLSAALPHVDAGTSCVSAQRVAERLISAAVDAAARAAGLLIPVHAGAAHAPCGIAYRRRVVQNNGPTAGVRMCWNPEEQHELDPEPGSDPTLTVLHLQRTNGAPGAVLWNLGAHPVCLGKTSTVVSADWPGAAAQAISELLPGVLPLFALGACGDTHPWIATQADPAALRPLGMAVGGLAVALSRAVRPAFPLGENLTKPLLAVAQRTITIGTTELDLSAWRIGPLRVVAAPVELVQPLSAILRQRLPGPLMVMTNCNGWTGYWPAADDFPAGGYEIDAARAMGREPGDGEMLIAALEELVNGLDQ